MGQTRSRLLTYHPVRRQAAVKARF